MTGERRSCDRTVVRILRVSFVSLLVLLPGTLAFTMPERVEDPAGSDDRSAAASAARTEPLPMGTRGASLYPLQNAKRNVLDLSGLWRFQLDPKNEGEARGWMRGLPAPRFIPVPCSWNELFDDAFDYFGPAWYFHEVWVPQGFEGERIFLRVGSATYAAKVWVNGTLVVEHAGGHLPFGADVTSLLRWDRPNSIAIRVENELLPERVPPGPRPGTAGVLGVAAGFPATTYDFFPYAGIQRPVVLYTVPSAAFIEDVTVRTSLERTVGVVHVRVDAAGGYSGVGRARLGDVEAPLTFRNGVAETTLRVASVRPWSPADPHLYPLTLELLDGQRLVDTYALDVGIRTVEVRGDRLLLNGKPIYLRGFGGHEDFVLSGRGLNLPMWVRDFELLRWTGANSFRTSHYPYAEEAMQLADRLGVLVINEIPAVGLSLDSPPELVDAHLARARQQLAELIARDKNHPSTIIWNVANEPRGRPAGEKAAISRATIEAGDRFFRALYDEAYRLDGTRPVTVVGLQGSPREWHAIFDLVCINRYYGWYTLPGQIDKAIEALTKELDALHAAVRKPILVTEFGADAISGGHSQPPEMWTEDYQAELLRRSLDALDSRSFVVGAQVWALADFKTGQGVGRALSTNFKGVFTRDRQPKEAARMLRLRWVLREGAPKH